MLASIIRAAIRTHLINSEKGQTCSDLVRSMGLDPRRHKGTIHALMVDMESDGILWAEINPLNGKRDKWHIQPECIRKRDRLIAAISGV
jgi:hypothetical protein